MSPATTYSWARLNIACEKAEKRMAAAATRKRLDDTAKEAYSEEVFNIVGAFKQSQNGDDHFTAEGIVLFVYDEIQRRKDWSAQHSELHYDASLELMEQLGLKDALLDHIKAERDKKTNARVKELEAKDTDERREMIRKAFIATATANDPTNLNYTPYFEREGLRDNKALQEALTGIAVEYTEMALLKLSRTLNTNKEWKPSFLKHRRILAEDDVDGSHDKAEKALKHLRSEKAREDYLSKLSDKEMRMWNVHADNIIMQFPESLEAYSQARAKRDQHGIDNRTMIKKAEDMKGGMIRLCAEPVLRQLMPGCGWDAVSIRPGELRDAQESYTDAIDQLNPDDRALDSRKTDPNSRPVDWTIRELLESQLPSPKGK